MATIAGSWVISQHGVFLSGLPTNDRDSSLLRTLGRVRDACIRDAAQSEGQRARARRERRGRDLHRIQLQRRGLSDRDLGAVLLFDVGADGEDADILEQGLARINVRARLLGQS